MDKDITVKICEERLEELLKFPATRRINGVFKKLSIFDWWKEGLSVSNQKDMLSFLKKAEKMGFNGYCCFKVGVSGSASGMWAYKEMSKDGFSPDGDFLYRSFTPDYTEWVLVTENNEIRTKTYRELKKSLEEKDA